MKIYFLLTFTAAVLSFDAFAVGAACGMQKIKFSAGGLFAFVLSGLLCVTLASFLGSKLAVLSAGRALCGAALVLAGTAALLGEAGILKNLPLPDLPLLPRKTDKNGNNKIEFKEAFFLAFVLSADGFAACTGSAADAGGAFLPMCVFVFHQLFLLGGMAAGKHFAMRTDSRLCGTAAGVMLFLLGINILC